MIKYVVRYSSIKLWKRFTPILVGYLLFQFELPSSRYVCHCLRQWVRDAFNDVFFAAGVVSGTLMNCACFVVSGRSLIPKTSSVSCTTFETKIELLPGTKNRGWQAFLVKIMMINLAVLMAVGLATGYAKAYLWKSLVAVMIISCNSGCSRIEGLD